MTVRSSTRSGRDDIICSRARDVRERPQALAQRYSAKAGSAGRTGPSGRSPLSGPSRPPLVPLRDLLADRRRPLRPRPRDGVRDTGGVRRHLVAQLQPDSARARERRHPRLADDDVLRRALLHAPASDRHARDVERAAGRVVRLGVEPDVSARDHRPADGPQPGPRVRRVHLADRHLAARDLARVRRQHPRHRLAADDPPDLRHGLVLHSQPHLARGRLRDRQRHLASRAHLGRSVRRVGGKPVGRDAQLVVRAQPVRSVVDADADRDHVLHGPAHHEHAAVQLHPLPHLLLGNGVPLHRCRRPPHPPVPDALVAEDDRGGVLVGAADPRLRVHDQHPRDDEGQLGQVLHELTPALHPHGFLLLLPREHPGSVRGDPAVQQAAALHQLRRRTRALSAAGCVHDPRDGRDRLHRRAGLRAALIQPHPHRVAVLARHRRVHRLLQRADARRLPAGVQLGRRHSRGQRPASAPRLLHRARASSGR